MVCLGLVPGWVQIRIIIKKITMYERNISMLKPDDFFVDTFCFFIEMRVLNMCFLCDAKLQ